MTVKIPGYSSVSGRPEIIVSLMQEARLFDAPVGDDYIEVIVADVERCFEVVLEVKGDSYEERSESLLRELAKHNINKIEEE